MSYRNTGSASRQQDITKGLFVIAFDVLSVAGGAPLCGIRAQSVFKGFIRKIRLEQQSAVSANFSLSPPLVDGAPDPTLQIPLQATDQGSPSITLVETGWTLAPTISGAIPRLKKSALFLAGYTTEWEFPDDSPMELSDPNHPLFIWNDSGTPSGDIWVEITLAE